MQQSSRWLDKIVDLMVELDVPPTDDIGLVMHMVKEKSDEKALEMAEYLYKDYLENAHQYPEFEKLGEQLENFTINEKVRVLGAMVELSCYRSTLIIHGKEIWTVKGSDIALVAKRWNLDFRKLMAVFF